MSSFRGGRGRGGSGAGQKRPSHNDPYGKKARTALANSHRFLIPAELVQGIIGKGGQHIKEITAYVREVDPEAKISIYAQCANGEPLMDGAADRVMGIQATVDGLQRALEKMIPHCQFAAKTERRKKLEVRFLAPAHTTSSVIGRGGEIVKRLKEETKSFIQVYTLPLPMSEETVIRMQNFELEDMISTVLRVVEAVAPNKSERPIIFYDPIWFNQGDFGDTGSYVDTFWFQDAISSGQLKLTPYSGRKNHQGPNLGQSSYGEWGDNGGYDGGYGAGAGGYEDYGDSYGPGRGYDASYYPEQGYGGGYGEDYGNYDHLYEDSSYSTPPKRGRGSQRGGRGY